MGYFTGQGNVRGIQAVNPPPTVRTSASGRPLPDTKIKFTKEIESPTRINCHINTLYNITSQSDTHTQISS